MFSHVEGNGGIQTNKPLKTNTFYFRRKEVRRWLFFVLKRPVIKSEHELLLDLAAKSRNTVSADLPDYIMEKDIVRAALRVAKEVDATDEEWQTFMKMLKERKR